MSLRIFASVSENKGKVRSNNEDNFYLNGRYLNVDDRESGNAFFDKSKKKINVYAVFDGMGGEEFGEDAALIAAKTTKKFHNTANLLRNNLQDNVAQSINEANLLICKKIDENQGKRIGTTLASLIICEDIAHIYNIGDSRVYLLRNGKLNQISIDDTVAQRLINIGILDEVDAKTHPDRHKLTQHLGIYSHEMIIEPHIVQNFRLVDGDKFLLCSDGLTDMVDDTELEEILMSANDSRMLSQMLVARALEKGGRDNVTAMVVYIKQTGRIGKHIGTYVKNAFLLPVRYRMKQN